MLIVDTVNQGGKTGTLFSWAAEQFFSFFKKTTKYLQFGLERVKALVKGRIIEMLKILFKLELVLIVNIYPKLHFQNTII